MVEGSRSDRAVPSKCVSDIRADDGGWTLCWPNVRVTVKHIESAAFIKEAIVLVTFCSNRGRTGKSG
jgi:hypothetical protein